MRKQRHKKSNAICMRKFKICLLVLLALITLDANGQAKSDKFKSYTWNIERMDSKYNPPSQTVTGKIISKYKPSIDELLEPIGTTVKEMDKGYPEGELSNWAVDALKECANNYLKENRIQDKCDFTLLNFGGIRAALPKGEINSYDILTIFPFDNYVTILYLEGRYVRLMMENFAKRGKVEPMGGVEIEISGKELAKCLINGKPINDKKVYRVATIDFLLQGGDSVWALKYASKTIETNKVLRDVFIEYIKSQTKKGRVIDAQLDGRAKL